MPTINYATIAPNVANITVQGSQVRIAWKDPVTGAAMGESSATMAADSSVGGRVQESVKRSVVNEIAATIVRFVTSLIGGSAGRVVNNAAYTASSELQSRALSGASYTESSRQAAIVQAFESVRSFFVWDEANGRFVSK
jgi:hypothetical protein